MKRRDFVAGLVLAGIGILVTLQSRAYTYLDEFGPGPGFLPYWLGLILLAFAVSLIIVAIRTRVPTTEPESVRPGTGRAMLAGTGLAVMAATLESVGFFAGFALLAFFLIYAVERRPLAGAIGIAAAMAFVFFLLFYVIIPLPLPAGAWGF